VSLERVSLAAHADHDACLLPGPREELCASQGSNEASRVRHEARCPVDGPGELPWRG